MTNFRTANTPTLNNVRGFCVHLPQWTRTIRSSLKGWRYDMRWERIEKSDTMELVILLMEDNQNRASYETGMELWRLVLPEARADLDMQQQHHQLEVEAEFKVAHLEWVLGQALYSTLQPEITKTVEETQRALHRTEAAIKKVQEENENALKQITTLNESNVAMNDAIMQATKEHAALRRSNEALRNVLALAEHALTAKGAAKVKTAAKVKALEAIKELHEVVWGRGPDPVADDEHYVEPYEVRKCWFETPPEEELLGKVVDLVVEATDLNHLMARRYVLSSLPFVVLPDRWDKFQQSLPALRVFVGAELQETQEEPGPIECWFTDRVTENKIAVIKLVREFSGLGLLEAKEATECNGHFLVPFALWPHWQEEIAKQSAAQWTYRYGSSSKTP